MLVYNKLMGTYLDIYNSQCLCEKNMNDLKIEFLERDSYILLNQNNKAGKLNIEKMKLIFFDKTQLEATYNEITPEIFFLSKDLKNNNSILAGIKISEIIEKDLKKYYPNYSFNIILSYNGTNTSIRFHKYRKEEGNWIDIENLEQYKEEAILVRII